jgi:nicotinamide riboside kinase
MPRPPHSPIRIVLTGPESTGKSALTHALARRFSVPSADEYARRYLETHGPDYDADLLLEIARGHRLHQQVCVPPSEPVGLLDTDLINYAIWFEVVFGQCPDEVLHAMERETHHAYLLCAPDLPWEPDPLRENPDDREHLFDLHRARIEHLGRPYRIIRGIGHARTTCAEAAYRELTT